MECVPHMIDFGKGFFRLRSLPWLRLQPSQSVLSRHISEAFLPLTEKVSFKTIVQRGNRLQINRHIRWRYKLESNRYLSVRVDIPAFWGASESFICRITKDGRMVIPQLVVTCLIERAKKEIEGYLVQVTLEPFWLEVLLNCDFVCLKKNAWFFDLIN